MIIVSLIFLVKLYLSNRLNTSLKLHISSQDAYELIFHQPDRKKYQTNNFSLTMYAYLTSKFPFKHYVKYWFNL